MRPTTPTPSLPPPPSHSPLDLTLWLIIVWPGQGSTGFRVRPILSTPTPPFQLTATTFCALRCILHLPSLHLALCTVLCVAPRLVCRVLGRVPDLILSCALCCVLHLAPCAVPCAPPSIVHCACATPRLVCCVACRIQPCALCCMLHCHGKNWKVNKFVECVFKHYCYTPLRFTLGRENN